MSEIYTYGEAKLTQWEINKHYQSTTLTMRFDNDAKIILDNEAVEQLLEIVPKLKPTYHALEDELVKAIDQWMRVPTEEERYAHGNAQGIARALATLYFTSFSVEWGKGLDRYQNQISTGENNG